MSPLTDACSPVPIIESEKQLGKEFGGRNFCSNVSGRTSQRGSARPVPGLGSLSAMYRRAHVRDGSARQRWLTGRRENSCAVSDGAAKPKVDRRSPSISRVSRLARTLDVDFATFRTSSVAVMHRDFEPAKSPTLSRRHPDCTSTLAQKFDAAAPYVVYASNIRCSSSASRSSPSTTRRKCAFLPEIFAGIETDLRAPIPWGATSGVSLPNAIAHQRTDFVHCDREPDWIRCRARRRSSDGGLESCLIRSLSELSVAETVISPESTAAAIRRLFPGTGVHSQPDLEEKEPFSSDCTSREAFYFRGVEGAGGGGSLSGEKRT